MRLQSSGNANAAQDMKKTIGTFLIAAVGAATGFGLMQYFGPNLTVAEIASEKPFIQASQPVERMPIAGPSGVVPDFVEASAKATPAVVHIKSYYKASSSEGGHGFFSNPYGGIRPQSAGSGVIISEDGYISTNNHVIKNAVKVEVVLEDKRSYEAEIVGADPTTDLALLKIKAQKLPFLAFGSSNDVQVGEWVLAVGNPFNLTSTVTAGIVSAKGRSLNLLNEDFAIESFIQTDAAVNPGNSGGALINTAGNLVGINTAIASETGSYAGYSFAVPASIVQKVMEDLRQYGEVQRGIIGVQIRNINAEFAEKASLKTLDGAYVSGTIPGGAAEASGIKAGDIITKVEGTSIKSSSELQERIGTYRPGDHVKLEVIRNNEPREMEVILRSREGKTTLSEAKAKPENDARSETGKFGALMETIGFQEKSDFGLDNGVKVVKIEGGKLREAGIEEGFIITRVNKTFVETPKQVQQIIEDSEGGILIEGLTATGKKQFYAFE